MTQWLMLTESERKVLARARETYGNTNQILVSNEELCELAAVCAKFPRYDDPEKARRELGDKAIDEVADVLIVLDHIINIFQLKPERVAARIDAKVDRLHRWLDASNSQEQTMIDREVREGSNNCPCKGCAHVGQWQELKMGGRCFMCVKQDFRLFEPRFKPSGGYQVRHQADDIFVGGGTSDDT